MGYTGEFEVFENIIQEMSLVYQHDQRPWMIGFSGGKDSTLLCCLVIEMLQRLTPDKRTKTVYIVTSDTMVENPIVRDYMHKMSNLIGKNGKELRNNLSKGGRYLLVQGDWTGIPHAGTSGVSVVYRPTENPTDECLYL